MKRIKKMFLNLLYLIIVFVTCFIIGTCGSAMVPNGIYEDIGENADCNTSQTK